MIRNFIRVAPCAKPFGVVLRATAWLILGVLVLSATGAPAAEGDLQMAFAFISKRSDLSDDQLRERYEASHVPGALKVMVPMGFRHYVRNYVQRALGTEPDFEVISEFGFAAGSTGPDVCGQPIDPNWRRNRSVVVMARPIAVRLSIPGNEPIRKRALLLRQPQAVSAAEFEDGALDFATSVARTLGDGAHRVTLYLAVGTTREVHECIDADAIVEAIVMIWPKPDIVLPDSLRTPSSVALTSILDLEAVTSVIPRPE